MGGWGKTWGRDAGKLGHFPVSPRLAGREEHHSCQRKEGSDERHFLTHAWFLCSSATNLVVWHRDGPEFLPVCPTLYSCHFPGIESTLEVEVYYAWAGWTILCRCIGMCHRMLVSHTVALTCDTFPPPPQYLATTLWQRSNSLLDLAFQANAVIICFSLTILCNQILGQPHFDWVDGSSVYRTQD